MDRPEELVEAALHGPIGALDPLAGSFGRRDMPLATHERCVARSAENLGDSDALLVQAAPVRRDRLSVLAVLGHHVPHSSLVRIQPRDQGRPRGAATRVVVERAEAKPLSG